MNHLITVTKSDGTKQLFEEEKLVNSLRRVGTSTEMTDRIVDEIERDMWEGMPTADIYGRAFKLLEKHSRHTAIKYSLRRALFELGPDGFPFEKFVARVFQAWGYETATDQMLMGACGVEHEIDVVAWKGEELAMVEAKFHNEFGLKSDLKVVLYVKERFDDLSGNYFDYGGKSRKLTERWLFTNTKFTESATTYGECKDLKLIGWNYPPHNSLHEVIDKYGLQPITSLTSLSHQEKKDLLGKGVIVCSDLSKNPEILHNAGLREDTIERMMLEAQTIGRPV